MEAIIATRRLHSRRINRHLMIWARTAGIIVKELSMYHIRRLRKRSLDIAGLAGKYTPAQFERLSEKKKIEQNKAIWEVESAKEVLDFIHAYLPACCDRCAVDRTYAYNQLNVWDDENDDANLKLIMVLKRSNNVNDGRLHPIGFCLYSTFAGTVEAYVDGEDAAVNTNLYACPGNDDAGAINADIAAGKMLEVKLICKNSAYLDCDPVKRTQRLNQEKKYMEDFSDRYLEEDPQKRAMMEYVGPDAAARNIDAYKRDADAARAAWFHYIKNDPVDEEQEDAMDERENDMIQAETKFTEAFHKTHSVTVMSLGGFLLSYCLSKAQALIKTRNHDREPKYAGVILEVSSPTIEDEHGNATISPATKLYNKANFTHIDVCGIEGAPLKSSPGMNMFVMCMHETINKRVVNINEVNGEVQPIMDEDEFMEHGGIPTFITEEMVRTLVPLSPSVKLLCDNVGIGAGVCK